VPLIDDLRTSGSAHTQQNRTLQRFNRAYAGLGLANDSELPPNDPTGVRLIVWCRDRRHRVEPDPEAQRYGVETTLPNWRERLVCSECRFERGLNTADVLLLRLFTPTRTSPAV
jgi:hypothetical protein